MAEKVEMYACFCYRCGKIHEDDYGYVAFVDSETAR